MIAAALPRSARPVETATDQWRLYLDASGSIEGFAGNSTRYRSVLFCLADFMSMRQAIFYTFGTDLRRVSNANVFQQVCVERSTYRQSRTDIARVLRDICESKTPPKVAMIVTDGVQSLANAGDPTLLEPISAWLRAGRGLGIVALRSQFNGPAFSEVLKDRRLGNYRGFRPFYLFIFATDSQAFAQALSRVQSAMGSESGEVKYLWLAQDVFGVRALPIGPGCVTTRGGKSPKALKWLKWSQKHSVAEFSVRAPGLADRFVSCFDATPSPMTFDSLSDPSALLKQAVAVSETALRFIPSGSKAAASSEAAEHQATGRFEPADLSLSVLKGEITVSSRLSDHAPGAGSRRQVRKGQAGRASAPEKKPLTGPLAPRVVASPMAVGPLPDDGQYVVRAEVYLDLQDALRTGQWAPMQWIKDFSIRDDSDIKDYYRTYRLRELIETLMTGTEFRRQPVGVFYLYLHKPYK
jgi:hypothetical protein